MPRHASQTADVQPKGAQPIVLPFPLTNQQKVFYPATGFTKGDVVQYYSHIAPVMLPYLAGRAVTVKRLPEGIGGLSFFEKRAAPLRPEWVHTATVTSTSHGSMTFVVIDNLDTLVWLANRAAIEFHTYLFQHDHEEAPTTMVFDLDPGPPASLLECLPVALELRDVLNRLGLRSFAKSSGGKGLHLIVPLDGKAPFAEVKAFALSVARHLEKQHPDIVVTRMTKSLRNGKILIDWSQNDHGKTTVCAYSLRAQEQPMVSAPLAWDEVTLARKRGNVSALRFDAPTLLQRVSEMGDLLAPSLHVRQALPALGDA
jgi:bifunctional non-homologous end joining protein LigD